MFVYRPASEASWSSGNTRLLYIPSLSARPNANFKMLLRGIPALPSLGKKRDIVSNSTVTVVHGGSEKTNCCLNHNLPWSGVAPVPAPCAALILALIAYLSLQGDET